MKLRLPLPLMAGLLVALAVPYSITIASAEEISANTTLTVDTVYSDAVTVTGASTVLTIGDGALNPKVTAPLMRVEVGANVEIKSGKLALDSGPTTNGPDNTSLFIGAKNQGSKTTSTVTVSGGEIDAKGLILLSCWMSQGVLTIDGGSVKAAGIYSTGSGDPAHGNQGVINLQSGRLVLGAGGMSADGQEMVNNLSRYTVNLKNGVLGSYESWSSIRKLILTLDSEGGNLDIEAAQGTTITLDSAIVGTGTGTLTKTGAGTLEIKSGDVPNTFTQDVALNAGTLIIDKDAALGTPRSGNAKSIAVTGDATLITKDTSSAFSFDVSDQKTLTIQKSGDVVTEYSGAFTGKGSLHLWGTATLSHNSSLGGNLTLSEGATVDLKGDWSFGGTSIRVGTNNAGGAFRTTLTVTEGSTLMAEKALMTISNWVDKGTLNVETGSKLKLAGLRADGSAGIVNINGGEVSLGATGIFSKVNGRDEENKGLFNFNSGIISSFADWSYKEDNLQETTAHFLLGNEEGTSRVIDTAEGTTINFKSLIGGDGGFTKTGEGVLILSKDNVYKGDTVVEGGSLYVGSASALGTEGTLTLGDGSAFASTATSSLTIANKVELGKAGAGEGVFTLGASDKTGELVFSGEVNINAAKAGLIVLANTTFMGTVTGNATSLTKQGTGTLTISQALTGVNELNLEEGKVVMGSTASGIGTFNVAAGTALDLGGTAGPASRIMNLAGAATLKGIGSFGGKMNLALEGTTDRERKPWTVSAEGDVAVKDLHFNSRNARLSTNGTFSAESVSFLLGDFNEVSSKNANATLITATGSTVTGTEKGSIYLDFDLTYVRENMDKGGKFQLFSTGLDYQEGSIQYTQRQEISVDTSALSADGSVSWSRIKLQGYLIASDYMTGTYTPSNDVEYLGAEANGGTPVKVGASVVYQFDDDDILTYKLTPGKGTLIYQGLLDNEDKGLDVIDYAGITNNEADRSQGNVTLTNNGNSYGGGTNLAGTTLVVDLSQGENPGLADQAVNGNLDVKALGTGEVTVTASLMGYAGTLRLQSYGDGTLGGVTTYTYANDFRLKDGSSLVQGGGNDQILTGNVTLEAGMNAIRNESGKSLTLKGNVTQTTGTGLVLENTDRSGKIVLEGSGKNLTVSQLEIRGEGKVDITNGYTANAREVRMTGGTLTVENQGEVIIGQGGISGSGTFALNGGTLKSASSWQSNTVITLGTGTNTINTGGANVNLNQGVTGEGGFIKQGTGFLYLYDNAEGNAKGLMDIRQGRLILLGAYQPENARMATDPASEYKLNGDLTLASGKGAGLQGKINGDGHNVTFGDGTHFYLEVEGEKGVSGYIRDAGTITIGTGTQLHVDVLDDSWKTSQTYAVFSGREDIVGAGNLGLALGEEYAFVDVGLDLSNSKEIGLYLTKKGGTPGGGDGLAGDGTNAGAIHAVVAPLAAGVLDDSVELTGKLKQHMQTVSKMTTTEYKTYLTDMGNSASSFYTALSAQVQDVTQHINSVRNRVELINPVMYDDWTQGGIYNVWAGGINHYRDVKSGSEAPGYEMTSWGGELGCAIPLSQSFMVGVGFAYTFSDVQVKDGWGSNDNDTYNVDLFARYRREGWTITGVLTGGFTNTEFHRNQILKEELLRANSSTDGNQFLGTLEVGYDFYLNEEKSWILQPLVNITAGRAKLDSLSETGEMKNAGLLIGSQSYNMFSAGVGAKIAYQYQNSVSDQPGRVELKAMYVNDMGDVDFEVNGRFIGAPGNGFDLKGVSNERSAALVSAGWIAPISAYGQFFVDAGCEFRKDQNGVNTTVGFSFQF